MLSAVPLTILPTIGTILPNAYRAVRMATPSFKPIVIPRTAVTPANTADIIPSKLLTAVPASFTNP